MIDPADIPDWAHVEAATMKARGTWYATISDHVNGCRVCADTSRMSTYCLVGAAFWYARGLRDIEVSET